MWCKCGHVTLQNIEATKPSNSTVWRVSGCSGRDTARAEDAQGAPNQIHISPSILVYEEKSSGGDMLVQESFCIYKAPEFRVQGSGVKVQGSGFRGLGSGFRVQGSGVKVQGSGSGFRIDRGHGGAGCASPRL